MRNIKLLIEYDGSKYFGWQKQPNAITIQEVVVKAIEELTKEKIELIGSSRTDSGVHAKGFIANFKTNTKIPAEKYREAINVKLPDDIIILKSEEVQEEFHARYFAKGKTYSYTIYNDDVSLAIGRQYALHRKDRLNIDDMKDACKYIIGKHDFECFKSVGGSAKTSVRTISELYIETYDKYIKIYITGDGFLYNMVRIIVGTLLDVGRGKIAPKQIRDIIDSKDRTKAGICVPARGLVLEKVYY